MRRHCYAISTPCWGTIPTCVARSVCWLCSHVCCKSDVFLSMQNTGAPRKDYSDRWRHVRSLFFRRFRSYSRSCTLVYPERSENEESKYHLINCLFCCVSLRTILLDKLAFMNRCYLACLLLEMVNYAYKRHLSYCTEHQNFREVTINSAIEHSIMQKVTIANQCAYSTSFAPEHPRYSLGPRAHRIALPIPL